MDILDLSGEWMYATDKLGVLKKPPKFKNSGFLLPGSTCDNSIGTPPKKYSKMTEESVKCLRERFEYIGVLWLKRKIFVPPSFAGKAVSLFLERVNISSSLWIDDTKIDREIIELSTPHKYDLTDKLSVGLHTITLRIDNRNLLNIHTMASGYSNDTQGFWCGIIGKIELRARSKTRIDSMQIFSCETGIDIKAAITSKCFAPNDREAVNVTLTPIDPFGNELESIEYPITLYSSRQTVHLHYEFKDKICLWDEHNPNIYTLRATLLYESKFEDEFCAKFGMRKIQAKKNELFINGMPLRLRGTLDCAIYPKTGYPPMDIKTWQKTFKTIKEYGFNHVRFHAWCPPDAAFTAADREGLYILAEMPLWLNYDVCPLETGSDPIHKTYFLNEALNISECFGNHPSFIMFSNGNELLGDFEMLENITTQVKAIDNRRLYTLTSNFDRPVTPADDFFCAVQANGHRIRIQVFHDIVSEHSRLSYDEAVENMPIPLVSFEVGQHCVYPDVDSISDYDGNMIPINFEIIAQSMEEHGIRHKLKDYVHASGKFAALLYKEDIECQLRTKKLGGFQILGLSDYTGQNTATIGMLDVFWKSKGILYGRDFKKFCNDKVPLLKTERIFYNTEMFCADLDLYGSDETDIEFRLNMYNNNTLIHSVSTRSRSISFPLDFIKEPSMITVTLSVCGYENSWTAFVYPQSSESCSVPIITGSSRLLKKIIENGGKAIVTGHRLKKPTKNQFKPVFWSPAFFKTDRSCGFMFDDTHPVFGLFPTAESADFQWKHPIDNSVSMDISEFPDNFKTIVESVPNFFENIPRSVMFEAHIGKAQILFCGFDLEKENKCIQQLKNSIFNYINSDKFNPAQKLDENLFLNMFK